MTSLTLSDLFIYPVKSAAGIRVDQAVLTPRGLECDRRYMIVLPSGHFITQRRFPKMALIKPTVSAAYALRLTAPGMPELTVEKPTEAAATVDVEVWGDRTSAVSCGSSAADWLSQFIGTSCQLVYMPETSQRPTDHGKFGTDNIVSFADAYPYLLLSDASLKGLNKRLAEKQVAPVSIDRFRPNLVVSGEIDPHTEDDWKKIRIGKTTFTVAKPCARCSIPNVNQTTGDRTKEPSRTLATYRTWNNEIWFGQNLLQEVSGSETSETLTVGDEVEILA